MIFCMQINIKDLHGFDYAFYLFSIRRMSASTFACLLKKNGSQVYQNGLELFFFKVVRKFFLTLVQFNN